MKIVHIANAVELAIIFMVIKAGKGDRLGGSGADVGGIHGR